MSGTEFCPVVLLLIARLRFVTLVAIADQMMLVENPWLRLDWRQDYSLLLGLPLYFLPRGTNAQMEMAPLKITKLHEDEMA